MNKKNLFPIHNRRVNHLFDVNHIFSILKKKRFLSKSQIESLKSSGLRKMRKTGDYALIYRSNFITTAVFMPD
jgi:hypothetical protein